MAISELKPRQQKEIESFWRRARDSYQRFQGVDYENITGNLVEPEHYGEFPEEGHVVLEVHGNMGDHTYFENLNRRLEESPDDFRPYAVETEEHSPSMESYAEELDRAYDILKSERGMESFSAVTHSLGCPAFLKWVHENDRYDELEVFAPSAGPFKGVASADLAEKIDRPVKAAESYAKTVSMFNPLISLGYVENFFEPYRISDVSDDFVSRRSAEEGELADLMEETTITEDAQVYTVRSSMDRWYNDLENTLPRGAEHLASVVSWENRVDSPEIAGADGNLVLPSSTHHEAVEGEIAVEYIARALEGR